MTTITLEIPDGLLPKLNSLNKQLPQLLSLAVSLYQNDQTESETTNELADSNMINIVLDFLVGSPSAEEIINYKVPEEVQTHLEMLLDKNREGSLNAYEEAELTSFQQLNHLLILLKARSRSQTIH